MNRCRESAWTQPEVLRCSRSARLGVGEMIQKQIKVLVDIVCDTGAELGQRRGDHESSSVDREKLDARR